MIPKILHQIWNDTKIPEAFRGYQQTWLTHHPGWTYRLWTAESARRFVAERCPRFLPIYDSYPRQIHRVDAVRYLWMQQLGGVYVDLDFECLKPLDEMLAGKELVVGYEPPTHSLKTGNGQARSPIVGNAFLASAPGHPFWDLLLRLLPDYAELADPVHATGPLVLTRAINAYRKRQPLTVLDANVLYPADIAACRAARGDSTRLTLPREAIAIHHWYGTWFRPDALRQVGALVEGRTKAAMPLRPRGRSSPVEPNL